MQLSDHEEELKETWTRVDFLVANLIDSPWK